MGELQSLEHEAPTREVTRARIRSRVMPGSEANTRPSATGLHVTADALRAEEMGRFRVTARVLMVVVGIGTAMVPFVKGDAFARQIMVGGLIAALVSLTHVHRLTGSPRTYHIDKIGALCTVLAFSLGTAVYFFGVFSPAPMIGSLGLYIFCLGSSTAWSIAMFGALAGVHAALAFPTIAGWIADRGLIGGGGLSTNEQVVIQLCVLGIYTIAFGAGRAARGKLVDAVSDMEATVRKVAERDAQLAEAKRELVRAAGVGGEGRFTDQLLGDYRLGNVIGRGGMGEVYEAQHADTGQEAAVKLLQRAAFVEPQSVARFAREAQAAASLDSPHVVRVLQMGEADAVVPFLVMERLRGEDLGSLLRREKRLSRRDTLDMVRQVGAALDAARRAGVVHRDLKPQNLFLARTQGAPVWKVLDFGVSKVANQPSLTRDQLVGTPEYMPPEQAQGADVDYRADLYALSAVTYRCLTGRPPHHGADLAAVVYNVVHTRPLLPSKTGRVPTQMDAVLAIGMAHKPGERFASGQELARAVEDALTGELTADIVQRAAILEERTPWRQE